MSYKVKIRIGSAVERHTAQTLDAAVALARERLAAVPLRTTATLPFREVAPVAQVAARAEIAGEGRHGGIDVRGDGSAEAYTGSIRKRPVAQEPGESAIDALRRALG